LNFFTFCMNFKILPWFMYLFVSCDLCTFQCGILKKMFWLYPFIPMSILFGSRPNLFIGHGPHAFTINLREDIRSWPALLTISFQYFRYTWGRSSLPLGNQDRRRSRMEPTPHIYIYILYNKYYSSLPVLRFVFGPLKDHFQLPGHDLIKSCTFIVLTCVVLLAPCLCGFY